MSLSQDDDVGVISTGSQEGKQLDAKAAATVPIKDPGSSLAPAPLGAGNGTGGGGGRALQLLPLLAVAAALCSPGVGC